MSRSGYSSDYENVELYRNAVERAIRGKRGQAFLREMRDAMDAMPAKALIADEIVTECGECCAIGSVALARKIDVSNLDPGDPYAIGAAFGIAQSLVREIEYVNDEDWYCQVPTPEQRWTSVRQWLDKHIVEPKPEATDA